MNTSGKKSGLKVCVALSTSYLYLFWGASGIEWCFLKCFKTNTVLWRNYTPIKKNALNNVNMSVKGHSVAVTNYTVLENCDLYLLPHVL